MKTSVHSIIKFFSVIPAKAGIHCSWNAASVKNEFLLSQE
ncbi:Uncharacterized protein dnm_057650 [Desulfonema magnum]|uniref:Uncharacterized protein n=1 Tax=Desulfonema magnum TaxID=45655 RepID=A0A975BQE3_9BACT|nr:Uncharacterized protein dnm_057650 [Desulfonema magnum]